jgi:hypothetical protein
MRCEMPQRASKGRAYSAHDTGFGLFKLNIVHIGCKIRLESA